ncbi:ABC transporter substrate-binding protein [Pseudoruminococcus massiliensis]|jgi:ABC-type Fe3+-hydroxamate transport system substrate-binding protein|uniref:ABC transporter substrate-binding protein n=1 Tax=Pseudoruminococcus massiliensis TaxID=2086583 RepID=UPI002F91CCB8|nr:ABC transporter substrate-binding protein [Clostridium sp.]
MFKKIVALALAAGMVLSATACNSSRSEEYPVKLANITISKAPDRVIVLSDSIADILVSCGFIKKIEGRSDECTQEEISGVKTVGSKLKPDLEKISALSPDVIFADSDMPKEQLTKLNESGFTVITFVPATSMSGISDLFGNVGAVMAGETTGREIGEERAETLSVTMDDLQRLIPESKVLVTACYLYDEKGTSLKDDTPSGKLFEYLNAVNVCKAGVADDEAFNALKLANPQYIFCDIGVKDKIMKSELFKDFSAVKNKQVYELSSELFSRQGNSLVEALTDMIEIMYPSVSINPEDPIKRTESSKAETSKAETSKAETSKAETSKAETSKAETSKAETSKAETSKAETSKAETSKAETSKATTSKVKADTSLKITKDMFFEFGDIKDDIKKVQNRLEALGYFNEEKSGYYGEVTQKAVKAFQKANKLTQSGNCDYKTLTLMFSAKAKAAG